MKLTSSAFDNNSKIPQKYTCDGENISPPLTIEGAPTTIKSFSLIVDDPDAPVGTWDHWVLYNIGNLETVIEEGSTPNKAMQGRNSWGNNGYNGPCPPNGTHHYHFRLYALDTILDLEEGATKHAVMKKMESQILSQTELIGLYRQSLLIT